MEQRDLPIRLTEQEFDAMMGEFDDAGGWMLQQIRQKGVMPPTDTSWGRPWQGYDVRGSEHLYEGVIAKSVRIRSARLVCSQAG
jgi:hypothetical protein